MQKDDFQRWFVQQMEAVAERVVEQWANNPPGLNPWWRFGTVVALDDYKPVVKFDWETDSDARIYPFLANYTPKVGDRVLISMAGGMGVVVCKIANGPPSSGGDIPIHTHSWVQITDTPNVYPPAPHTHTPEDIGAATLDDVQAVEQLANAAQSAADAAAQAAATAQQKADQAVSAVSTVQSTANTAITVAQTAQSTANTAQSAAMAAQETADAAQETAYTALSTAQAAGQAAANAQSTADSATALAGIAADSGLVVEAVLPVEGAEPEQVLTAAGPAVQFSSGATQSVTFCRRWPFSGQALAMELVLAASAANSGAFRLRIGYQVNGGTVTNVVRSVTPGAHTNLYVADLGQVISAASLPAGALVTLTLSRLGADAADTHPGALLVYHCRLKRG